MVLTRSLGACCKQCMITFWTFGIVFLFIVLRAKSTIFSFQSNGSLDRLSRLDRLYYLGLGRRSPLFEELTNCGSLTFSQIRPLEDLAQDWWEPELVLLRDAIILLDHNLKDLAKTSFLCLSRLRHRLLHLLLGLLSVETFRNREFKSWLIAYIWCIRLRLCSRSL